MGEEIAGLADRPHHVEAPHGRIGGRLGHRQDRMISIVKRRADQVVHRRILNDVAFAAGFLVEEHPAEQNPGVSDNEPPRFQHQLATGLGNGGKDDLGEGGSGKSFVFAVMDAETAAHVQEFNRVPLLPQCRD